MTPTWSSQRFTDGGLCPLAQREGQGLLKAARLCCFQPVVWKVWRNTYPSLVLQARQRLYCLLGGLGKRRFIHRRPREGAGGGQGGGEGVMMGRALPPRQPIRPPGLSFHRLQQLLSRKCCQECVQKNWHFTIQGSKVGVENIRNMPQYHRSHVVY